MVILSTEPLSVSPDVPFQKLTSGKNNLPTIIAQLPPITLRPAPSVALSTPLLSRFIAAYKELESYKKGKVVTVDGKTLTVATVTAVARYHASVRVDNSDEVKEHMAKSRNVIANKVQNGISVYGITTGYGGSADTRTDKPLLLGNALLQHQHSGVLPSSQEPLDVLPLTDPLNSTTMPESWVRGAILVRMNSLIRGHSGVRIELVEKMNSLLDANITPVIPLRGSISASGDLSPLSYIAGTIMGNPSIRVFDGPATFGGRQIVSSRKALEAHGIEPLPLASKEPLGILNGTAVSASVAALALNDAVHFALLSQVCTAMGVEALAGTRASFDKFIHDVCRPHKGQVESAHIIWDLLEGSRFAQLEEEELNIAEDEGILKQDRYPLRTAAQWIGPQLEGLLASLDSVTQECNSTTDNPLIDGATGHVHHGGNFQAMAITTHMESTRLALHHFGKLLFSQLTELLNPAMNRGLPPNLAASDPSLNYHCKGIDIATAAYTAELGYLASPVSTHVQSAEMHNQAVNSLALISARATITSLEVLSLLVSSYIYVLCQALDLRALQFELNGGIDQIVAEELETTFEPFVSAFDIKNIGLGVCRAMRSAMESTSSMDSHDRMQKVAESSTTILVDYMTSSVSLDATASSAVFSSIPMFRSRVATRLADLHNTLRTAFLSGQRGSAPASKFLNKTRPIYEFVRNTLEIRMHGAENHSRYENGLGVDDQTIGQNVSLIHESIRDGRLQSIVVSLFS